MIFVYFLIALLMSSKLVRKTKVTPLNYAPAEAPFFKQVQMALMQSFLQTSSGAYAENLRASIGIPERIRQFHLVLRPLSELNAYLLDFQNLILDFSKKNIVRQLVFLSALAMLLFQSSRLANEVSEYSWIYIFSENYLSGALMAFGIALILRHFLRTHGFSWWFGIVLLLSGIGSLGFCWGLFIGEAMGGAVDDCFHNRTPYVRTRTALSLGLLGLGLALTPIYENVVLILFNDFYSPWIRVVQYAGMTMTFWAVDLILASVYFHFFYILQTKHKLT